MKTFSIKTLGCKVNQCDSNEIRDRFLRSGMREKPDDGTDADVLVVNTCCVTHQADRKSRNAIRDAARRSKGGRSLVAVLGCYAGYNRPAIEKIEGVSAVFENDRKEKFFEWMQDHLSPKHGVDVAPSPFCGRTRAFLKIQEGCDNNCSYCIVPFVRGRSRSKELSCVIREANELIRAGHKEIVLTGVNLGSYGKDLDGRIDLVSVIEALEPMEGLTRIRLSSIEAADISERLIEKMAQGAKLCPHLHIPFQSGDDGVLADMNKGLRTRDYRQIVQKARQNIKGLAITCDLIVGFPSEGEKRFSNTLEFLEFVAPLRTHIFTFSEREGAPIFGRKNISSVDVIKKRFKALKKLSDELSLKFRQSYLGKEVSVLFEEEAQKGTWQGYSDNYIKVFLRSDSSLRNVLKVLKIADCSEDGVLAESLSNFS